MILRFHEEALAKMGDIWSIFLQVLVPEHDISVLKFLWWDDQKINQAVADFEMKVHVFGASSSTCCFNYALKRTAVDNKKNMAKMMQEHYKKTFMSMTYSVLWKITPQLSSCCRM